MQWLVFVKLYQCYACKQVTNQMWLHGLILHALIFFCCLLTHLEMCEKDGGKLIWEWHSDEHSHKRDHKHPHKKEHQTLLWNTTETVDGVRQAAHLFCTESGVRWVQGLIESYRSLWILFPYLIGNTALHCLWKESVNGTVVSWFMLGCRHMKCESAFMHALTWKWHHVHYCLEVLWLHSSHCATVMMF